MVWLYPMVKNLTIYLFGLTEHINVTDGQTDGQTPHNSIGRAYIYIASSSRKIWGLANIWLLVPHAPRNCLSQVPRRIGGRARTMLVCQSDHVTWPERRSAWRDGRRHGPTTNVIVFGLRRCTQSTWRNAVGGVCVKRDMSWRYDAAVPACMRQMKPCKTDAFNFCA